MDDPIKDWDPEHALKALAEEREVTGDTPEETAAAIFKASLPVAAAAVCHLAEFSGNEMTRLRAATYVVERNLGRLQDTPQLVDNPFDKFLKDMEAVANGD